MAMVPNLQGFSTKFMFPQTDCHTVITTYRFFANFALFYAKTPIHYPVFKFYFPLKTTYFKPKREVLFHQAHFHSDSICVKLHI